MKVSNKACLMEVMYSNGVVVVIVLMEKYGDQLVQNRNLLIYFIDLTGND